MYIPILKNRLFENKFIREYSYLFDKTIVPMIEIIEKKIGRTEKSIFEILEYYHGILKNEFFIDLFTFNATIYRPYSPAKVKYAVSLRNNYDEDYVKDLNEFQYFERAIPVVSVKKDRDFEEYDFINLIVDLKESNSKVAIRIEAEYFEEFSEIIKEYLDKDDFIMLDINEEELESKFMEMDYFENAGLPCKTVIISSPRRRKIKNGLYENRRFTDLIDVSLSCDYMKLGFDAYADYAMLKDTLPNDGGNGKGAALGLIYSKQHNSVYSIMNGDTEQGSKGHRYVIDTLMEEKTRDILDPKRDCLMYKFIEEYFLPYDKTGSWGQWKYITILRAISQIK